MEHTLPYEDRKETLEALQDLGGKATLHEIHNKTESELKIYSIYLALKSLDGSVSVEESRSESEISPNLSAEIVLENTIDTILHYT